MGLIATWPRLTRSCNKHLDYPSRDPSRREVPIHPNCTTARDPDSFIWVAHFKDGSELLECDGERCHVFAEIDLDQLEAFGLANSSDGIRVYAYEQTESSRLIFFRRMQQELNSGEPWRIINVIGMKITVGDRVAKVYEFILPDGSTLLSTNLNAV